MNPKPDIMIIAGEPSGDRIGALLAKALLQKKPDLKMTGVGGPLMKKEGVHLLEDMTRWAVVGIIEVIKNYWNFRRIFQNICRELERSKPKAIVLIDFPGFNLKLARAAHELGVRVIYYVSPQIWAWGKNRIHQIKHDVDRMMVILPFEEDFYRKEGVQVNFVGHPLSDFYKNYTDQVHPNQDIADQDPVISILPGSRFNEIDRHLDVLIGTAKKIKKFFPNACFLIPCATESIYQNIEKKIQGINYIRLYLNGVKECLAVSKLAWVCSGTATLETAFLGTPMILFYRVSPFTAFLARRLIKVSHVGLVNLVAQKKVAPELLQEDFTPEKLFHMSLDFLSNPAKLDDMKKEMNHLRLTLGGPGASERAAEIVLREIQS